MSEKVIKKLLYMYILIMFFLFPQDIKASDVVQTPETIVAQIGEKYFESIDDAIAYGDNLDISLLNSVYTITIPIGKNVSIETNGNNIEKVVNYGNLSIKNTSNIESKILKSCIGITKKKNYDIVSISNEAGAILRIENISIETNVDVYNKASTILDAFRIEVKGIVNYGDLYVNNCKFILKGKGESGFISNLYVWGIDNHSKLIVENSSYNIEGESISHGIHDGVNMSGECNVIGIRNETMDDIFIDNTNFAINYHISNSTGHNETNSAICNEGTGNVNLNMTDITCLMTECRQSCLTNISGIINNNIGKIDISNSRINVKGIGYYNHSGNIYGIRCLNGTLNVGIGDEVTEITVKSDYGDTCGIDLDSRNEKKCNVENVLIAVQSGDALGSYGICSRNTILSLGKAGNIYTAFPIVYSSIVGVTNRDGIVYLYGGLYGSDKDIGISKLKCDFICPEGAHEVIVEIDGMKFQTISDIYNITYNLNDGKWLDDVVADSYRYGTTLILSDQVIKDGYTFEGWYRSPDFSGEPVSKIEADSCEDIVLYAKWIKHSHIWDNGKVTETATCTENGKKTYVCKICGETRIEEIPAIVHSWDNGKVTETATCTENGKKTYVCKICGETRIEEIPAIVHSWDNGIITTNPTALKEGVRTYTCTVCGETKIEQIPAIGVPEKGVIILNSYGSYRVTRSGTKNATVEFLGTVSSKTSITIPDTVVLYGIKYKVTFVASNAFMNNRKLTKVTIGSNVTSIGKNAFSGCSKLKTITMGNNVTDIGDNAFYKCTALTKITIPSKVTKIGKQAFCNCKKLNSITIKTVKLTSKNVGSKAFSGTASNVKVKVPKSKISVYKKLLISKGISKKATIKK